MRIHSTPGETFVDDFIRFAKPLMTSMTIPPFPETTRSICESFRGMSTLIWELIEAEAVTGVRVDEPALTAVGLTWLRLAASASVSVKQHGTRREGQVSGADFELHIHHRGQSVGLLVQAKRVGPVRRRFHTLHKRAGVGCSQRDLLLKHARAQGFWPLYVLYTNAACPAEFAGHPCAGDPLDSTCCGCMAASPEWIGKLRQRRENSLIETLKQAVPWHCLVCPDHGDQQDPLAAIERKLVALNIPHADSRRLPDYVARALAHREGLTSPEPMEIWTDAPEWLVVVDLDPAPE